MAAALATVVLSTTVALPVDLRVGVSALAGAAGAAGAAPPTGTKPLVGAYYYLWNPENLPSGSLRAHLVPPQLPSPASVDSRSPATATRDIAEAHRAGIDFFAIDWWPYDAGYSAEDYRGADAAMRVFLHAPDLHQMKFAMFYETWNLGFDPAAESTPVTFQMELHFDADMIRFAHDYFHNSSYLRIGGRPVVFLYLTRTLTGDVAGMLRGARQVLAARGFDPYFIGDEVYWRVTPEQPGSGQPALTTVPQVQRIEQLDAVTSYILYFSDPAHPLLGPTKDSSGYPGTTGIVDDQKLLLDEYRAATGGRVPVVPDVAVGFNDRGFRLGANHPAEPRQWTARDGPASTLDHFFRCVAVPDLDPALPMVMVTSWDDWNEDTGIEPISGVPTRRDDSPSGVAYTQGYEYGHEGRSAVTALRRDVGLLDTARARPGSPAGRRAASLLASGC